MSASMFKGLPTSKILKQIARLNNITGTPRTAFKFGPLVKKIELIILLKNIFKASSGLKKFWRQNLPVLKYHNDDVEFTLTRVRAMSKEEIAQVPTKIVIHLADGTKSEVDCAMQTHNQILKKLVNSTGAVAIAPDDLHTIPVPENHLP
ncbi:CIC11C00000004822 [Sungouiella intermedia]|uniref:CIC11C00000004822 n=1 Tax=Sungouiella intermedia TaxID=45354 RepID=A0A1L0BPV7_9ASCO|nr:CIC11C00000004822 [[Candida] intermedia]